MANGRSLAWRSLVAGAVLAGCLGTPPGSRAEDAPPPPPAPPLERLFAPVKESMSDLPPFLRDTDLKLHLRSYYFDRTKPDGSQQEAWAFGGWLAYKSGWFLDTFGIGATFYGSMPLIAPDDKDGTLLLKPGQEGYFAVGEAYAALRYKEYVLLKGPRQLVDQSYINPQDNRMTPNTFEGITVGGKVGWAEYLGGYLWRIKPRNSDEFIPMSQQAGASGSDFGVVMAGVRLTPVEGLRIDVTNQYGVNTFNTFYAEAAYLYPLNEDWKVRTGVQFTDERAVGDALVQNAAEKKWVTQVGGARVQAIWRDLTLTTAFSITASGNTIQAPWGSYPGYLSIIDQDFDRANEKAVLIGAAYDFSKTLTKGLSANFNFAWGWDAINPTTRAAAPNQGEYDFTIDYRPPWVGPIVQGLWVRLRAAILDQQGAGQLGWQIRLILNWERDLI